MEKIICIVSEEQEETNIKKLVSLKKLIEINEIDDNFKLEYKIFDNDNQIWYKLTVEKC
jgi:hypothetical protein